MKAFCNLKCGVVVCLAGVASSAYAHGPQIQIGIEAGRIVTRSLIEDEPYGDAVTPVQRVYEIPMAERSLSDSNDGWYSQPAEDDPFHGPGIATGIGGFATGSVLSLTFVDGLKIWNGSTFVDPGAEQLDAYRGVTHVAGAVTSDTGPFQGFSYTAIANDDPDEHKETFFRLLGDGALPNTPSDDGVYLLSLRLLTDQPGVNPSEPYYFLLNKNASEADAAAALNYVNRFILHEAIPTVSEWGLVTLTLVLLAGAKIVFRSRSRGAVSV